MERARCQEGLVRDGEASRDGGCCMGATAFLATFSQFPHWKIVIRYLSGAQYYPQRHSEYYSRRVLIHTLYVAQSSDMQAPG